MADGAATHMWPSPLHDVLARYENAESAVKKLTGKINEYETLLLGKEISDRKAKRYEDAIRRAEEERVDARHERDSLESFYAVLSPVSETLDTMYQQIGVDPEVFRRPVKSFAPEEGTFRDLLRNDVDIPRNLSSSTAAPDFLTHALGKDYPNETPLFTDIVNTDHESIVGFYGTSGAGKTRTIFEIFVRSYGLYFVAADARTLNPGSTDLQMMIDSMDRFKNEASPREFSDYARVYTTVLILVRLLVFCALRHVLGEDLTCERWLRIQLTPKYYFGYDVFERLFSVFVSASSARVTTATQLSSKLIMVESEFKFVWENIDDSLDDIKFNVAFDEAQVLATALDGHFESSVAEESRSLLSPMSKTLNDLVAKPYHLCYPIFSGTGFSVAHIIKQLSSATGKASFAQTLHYDFKSLDKDGVEAYLKSILDLGTLEQDILEYTCKWLTGRPRWTVAFMDLLLTRKYANSGNLNDMFLQEIRRFVTVMTRPDAFDNLSTSERDSRLSWRYGKGSTARTAIERIQDDDNADRLNKVKEALVTHLFTDQPAPLSGEFTPKLVNVGLCQVLQVTQKKSRGDGINIKVTFTEPLVLEAALHSFLENGSLLKFVKDAILTGEVDTEKPPAVYMEYYTMLCAFKNMGATLDHAKKTTIHDDEDRRALAFEKLEMPTRSSCGKLVRNCTRTSQETLAWLENMNKFSSADRMDFIEPFCYPFDNFGADVITMMRRTSVNDLTSDDAFVPVMIQVKHPTLVENPPAFNEMDRKALLSVFPELVFRSKIMTQKYEYGGSNYDLFHWGVYNQQTLESILETCQQFFRVNGLGLNMASVQRQCEVEAENQYLCKSNNKNCSCTDFMLDLDWESRRRPVIMMVCQTGPGSDFLSSFLRHPGRGDADPKLIGTSDLDKLHENSREIHCGDARCNENIHDIVLAIDGGHDDLAGVFWGDYQFMEDARNATRTNRPGRH